MQIKGRRIFNYRPMLFFALAMIFGILTSELFYGNGVFVYLALFLIFLVAFILVCVFKKSRKLFYIPLALLVGFFGMTATNLQYNSSVISEYTGTFNAQISSEIVGKTSSNDNLYYTFTIDNIEVDGVSLGYKARVTAFFGENMTLVPGDVVSFYGTLSFNSHEKFDSYYPRTIANGTRYYAKVTSATRIGSNDLQFPTNLQLKIKKLLYENLDEKSSSIAKALVLGDKSGMDSDMYDDIKASGLAHVLAVSGLHVSTLATALYFLLRKIKVNPKVSLCIVVVSTLFYSMLCSFTASSLRAVIMSGTYAFASTFGRKRDDISTMSFAAILILLFAPSQIFDIGFLLSFASVGGIFLFAQSFERVGMKVVEKISPKRKIGSKFANVCAVSFATNLTTYPLVAYFFGEVPTLFVLSNFIVLPYIMVVYVIILVCTLLSVITSLGIFLTPIKYMLLPFRLFVGAMGSLSFSTVQTSVGIAMTITLTLIFVLASRFVFLDRVKKARICTIMLCIGTCLSTLLAIF